MSCNPKTGNLFKCADCIYFTYKFFAHNQKGYALPDGVCSKVFGRGYVHSKGEHKVNHNQLHCFQFVYKED